MTARTTDPVTSLLAAYDKAGVRPAQRMLLLAAFRTVGKKGLTAEEAATLVGLNRPGVCFWKRVSDLKKSGLLNPMYQRVEGRDVPITRVSDTTGRASQVLHINATGVAEISLLRRSLKAAA